MITYLFSIFIYFQRHLKYALKIRGIVFDGEKIEIRSRKYQHQTRRRNSTENCGGRNGRNEKHTHRYEERNGRKNEKHTHRYEEKRKRD